MKKILVTGATGGIGRDLSLFLARSGYEVILFARNSPKLEQLANCIYENSGYRPRIYSVDLSSIEQIDNFNFEEIGILDGLVLMPPQLPPETSAFVSPSTWEIFFKTSFIGPNYFLTKLVPNLKLSKRSKIVLVSGISSLQALGNYSTSNVLRCAWVAQAKTLSISLGKHSIHINTLSLGGVLTEAFNQKILNESIKTGVEIDYVMKERVSNVPLEKYASTRDVSYAIEGLLGRFSDHMTGVNLALDGGFTKAY
jgi:3-oxoacyl-[acyl-carrier protein] reductase